MSTLPKKSGRLNQDGPKNETPQISLGDSFGPAVIMINGFTLSFDKENNAVLESRDGHSVYMPDAGSDIMILSP